MDKWYGYWHVLSARASVEYQRKAWAMASRPREFAHLSRSGSENPWPAIVCCASWDGAECQSCGWRIVLTES